MCTDCCLKKKCVSEKAFGMQPTIITLAPHHVHVFLYLCVRIHLSLPQMMTLSAAFPRNASAEAAGTVW